LPGLAAGHGISWCGTNQQTVTNGAKIREISGKNLDLDLDLDVDLDS